MSEDESGPQERKPRKRTPKKSEIVPPSPQGPEQLAILKRAEEMAAAAGPIKGGAAIRDYVNSVGPIDPKGVGAIGGSGMKIGTALQDYLKSAGPIDAKTASAIGAIGPVGFGSRLQEVLRGPGPGIGIRALDPKVTQQYASAQALIRNTLEESTKRQEALDAAIASRRAIEAMPSAEAIRTGQQLDATTRVEAAVQGVGEIMDKMLVVMSSALTVSEQSSVASAKSDRTLRWLTWAMVALTFVLAAPELAHLWEDWVVPLYELLRKSLVA